jgi:hypothetical protein
LIGPIVVGVGLGVLLGVRVKVGVRVGLTVRVAVAGTAVVLRGVFVGGSVAGTGRLVFVGGAPCSLMAGVIPLAITPISAKTTHIKITIRFMKY